MAGANKHDDGADDRKGGKVPDVCLGGDHGSDRTAIVMFRVLIPGVPAIPA